MRLEIHVFERVDDRIERYSSLQLHGLGPEAAQPLETGRPLHLPDEPGLADPRLPGDEREREAALPDVAERGGERSQRLLPPHEGHGGLDAVRGSGAGDGTHALDDLVHGGIGLLRVLTECGVSDLRCIEVSRAGPRLDDLRDGLRVPRVQCVQRLRRIPGSSPVAFHVKSLPLGSGLQRDTTPYPRHEALTPVDEAVGQVVEIFPGEAVEDQASRLLQAFPPYEIVEETHVRPDGVGRHEEITLARDDVPSRPATDLALQLADALSGPPFRPISPEQLGDTRAAYGSFSVHQGQQR